MSRTRDDSDEADARRHPRHTTAWFGHAEGEFPIAERLGDQCISLPYYPGMLLPDVDLVAARMSRILASGVVSRSNMA